MMMRADENANIVEGCTAEELLACIAGDNYDECVASCGSEEEPTLPGYATVSTKAASSQTVALNAVDKKIGTVTLKAGENDTTVTNIEITKSGLGARTDILNVQLMKDGEYVTDGKAFNSDNVAKLRFRPSLTLKANSSETFDVVVSMAGKPTAVPGGTHNFTVTAVTVANGKFGGTPANLGSLTTSNYEVQPIVLNSFTVGGALKAGDENATLATVELKSSVKATINSITITSEADELNKAFGNAKAYIDDVEVGSVSINDETITITNLNKEITKSENVSVVVKADVIYVAETSTPKAFNLYIDENHVNAVESNTNERMTFAKISPAVAGLTAEGVKLTMKKNIKDTQTVAPGNNVKLLDLNIASIADLEVTKYYVQFPASFPFANFEDSEVTLYVDGIDYTIKAGDLDGSDRYVLTNKNDKFSVSEKNSADITLEGSVKSDAGNFTVSADSIKFYVTEIKNLENNKTLNGLTENKGCHTTKVTAGTYSVQKPTTMPTNKTVIAGEESDVLFFDLKASTENLILKEAQVTASAKFNTFATEVSLMQGDTVVKSFDDEDAELNNTIITFDSLTKNLNKDTNVPFTVRVNVKDETVTNLGNTFNVNLTKLVTARSAKPSVTTTRTTNLIAGNTYQITSATPTVALTAKAGKNTTVQFTNNSAYDLVLNTLTFNVTQNRVDGNYTDLSKATVKFLDAIAGTTAAHVATPAVMHTWTPAVMHVRNTEDSKCSDGTSTDQTTCEAAVKTLASCSDGTSTDQTTCEAAVKTLATVDGVAYTAGKLPGEVVITFGDNNTIGSTPLSRVIEIFDNANTLTDADYTINVRGLSFKFKDGTDESATISETYDISK